jgi:fumarate reductase subunit D
MTTDAKEHRVRAALSYVFVLFLLPMAKRESAFCQFHARQGMVLFLVWVLVSFVAWIPLVGWLAWLSMLILNVIAIQKTLKGEMWELPLIGKYAKKLNW